LLVVTDYAQVADVDLGGRRLLILSGQIAMDADGKLVGDGDMTAQAVYVFGGIEAVLAARGATLRDHVVNVRTYLTDMSMIGEYAAVRRGLVTGATCTTVEVPRLFLPGALVEVEVTAIVLCRRARGCQR
jgi:2-iminobutanoate/2-iminopropanoate deaminase